MGDLGGVYLLMHFSFIFLYELMILYRVSNNCYNYMSESKITILLVQQPFYFIQICVKHLEKNLKRQE